MKLLGISGSLRRASTNTMLVREAARAFGDCDLTLADIDLPLYNEDVEVAGMPGKVTTLIDQVAATDAIVISTPEYNKAPPGSLKNAFDWLSRVKPMPTVGKPCTVVAAAAGGAGGQRAVSLMYLMLGAFDTKLVVNPEVFIPASYEKFDEAGRLKDQKSFEFLERKMQALRALVD
ncbi:MAG: NADPH-dependent FMN reductase [Pseudomonadota bacterium]